jgi:hypothetical protein
MYIINVPIPIIGIREERRQTDGKQHRKRN